MANMLAGGVSWRAVASSWRAQVRIATAGDRARGSRAISDGSAGVVRRLVRASLGPEGFCITPPRSGLPIDLNRDNLHIVSRQLPNRYSIGRFERSSLIAKDRASFNANRERGGWCTSSKLVGVENIKRCSPGEGRTARTAVQRDCTLVARGSQDRIPLRTVGCRSRALSIDIVHDARRIPVCSEDDVEQHSDPPSPSDPFDTRFGKSVFEGGQHRDDM